MRYFLAIILSLVAVLLCGKPVQFLLNIILTILGRVPGVIHAVFVVNSHLADKLTERIIKVTSK
jgi:uncharacterized membrane protein YqaE (UPF0057 family)